LIYVQGIFGAVLRHTGERLDAHLLFAALVGLHVIFIFMRIMKFHSDRPELVRPARMLGMLLLLQLMLGTGSYFGKFTTLLQAPLGAVVFLTTTHLVTGALLLATSLLLTLRSYRLSVSNERAPLERKILTEPLSL
jgi:cytochrome bd-type quinol oxidase subunit 1